MRDGRLRLSRSINGRPRQVGVARPGELVGEMGLLLELPHVVTATAATPAPTTIADAIRLRGLPRGVAEAESDEEFERRTTGEAEFAPVAAFDLPTGPSGVSESGPLEAIKIYERLLTEYPNYERRDQVLYQMARAYDELGRTEEAMDVMQRLVGEFGYSRYSDEVQFRRGEYYFTRRRFREAEAAYEQIVAAGARSDFYELALYKLGWSLYKQDFYEEALHRYMALLDYKLPELDGVAVTHAVVREQLTTRVLLVSAYTDSGVVYKALETGASGFVSKEARREEIVDAVLDRINPAVGVVEAVSADESVLVTGADSLDTIGAYIGMLGMDFTVESPPELVPLLRTLSERYARAADGATLVP